jgi:hypothetical protein
MVNKNPNKPSELKYKLKARYTRMLIVISDFQNICRSNSLKAVAGDLRHFDIWVNIFYRKSLLSIRKIDSAAFLHSKYFTVI